MKTSRFPSPSSLAIPRLGSLLHRLQHAPAPPDDSPPCLDQLMVFLDDPPPGIRDRWKQGAKMCAAWGIPTTGSSVWRLYRAYVIAWRFRLAQEASPDLVEPIEALEQKSAQLVALRTLEVLAQPHLTPACLLGLARLELRKKALDLTRQIHHDKHIRKLDLALEELAKEVNANPLASTAFIQLRDILNPDEPFLQPAAA